MSRAARHRRAHGRSRIPGGADRRWSGFRGRRPRRAGARRPAPGGRPLGPGTGPAADVAACVADRSGSPSVPALAGGRRRSVASPPSTSSRPATRARSSPLRTPVPAPRDRGVRRRRWRRVLLGAPLSGSAIARERMRKVGRAADPLLRRAVIGRLRARGDARRTGPGRQRRAGPLARTLGGDRRTDGRGGPLLPSAHQGSTHTVEAPTSSPARTSASSRP